MQKKVTQRIQYRMPHSIFREIREMLCGNFMENVYKNDKKGMFCQLRKYNR